MAIKYVILIAAAAFLIAFFLGWIFCKITMKRHFDGTLVIERVQDRDVYRWIFERELEDFKTSKILLIRIRNSQNSQPV